MLVLVIAVVFGSFTTYAWDYKYCGSDPITDISVSLDGRLIDFGVSPQIINNRTMVAADKLFENLGAETMWLEESKTFSARIPYRNAENLIINITIGENKMFAYHYLYESAGEWIDVDSPAFESDGNILVPIRAIAEALNYKVVWEPDIKYVHIATLHRGNYQPAYIKDKDITRGEYSCEAVCDNKGRRLIFINAEGISPDDDMFIETQNGEYLFFKSGDNLTVTETENGYKYSIDYIPFPDTYTIYCYPTKDGEVTDRHTQVVVEWNRT